MDLLVVIFFRGSGYVGSDFEYDHIQNYLFLIIKSTFLELWFLKD